MQYVKTLVVCGMIFGPALASADDTVDPAAAMREAAIEQAEVAPKSSATSGEPEPVRQEPRGTAEGSKHAALKASRSLAHRAAVAAAISTVEAPHGLARAQEAGDVGRTAGGRNAGVDAEQRGAAGAARAGAVRTAHAGRQPQPQPQPHPQPLTESPSTARRP